MLQRNNIISNIFSYILIFFSALLKFYPIFLVFLFFKKSFWNKIFGIITFLTFLLYVLINYSDILLIKENTQQTFFFSYGYNVLEAGLNNIFYKLNSIFFAAKNYLFGDYESFKDGILHILYTNEFQDSSFIFSKLFLKIFSENRVVEKQPQKVFGCNFSKNKYFYLNPKAYEAAWPWL